jgi:small subunit ribosomal protein S21
MITVKVDGSIEKALKEWKMKFNTTKTLKELRERTQFEKKSVKRRNDVLKAAHKEKLRRNSE